jgi:protein O-GlcNAc transferase
LNRKARRDARKDGRPAEAEVAAKLDLVKRFAQMGDFSAALVAMDGALQTKPHDPRLHMWRGRVLSSMWRLDEAADSFRDALRHAGPDAAEPELVNARLGMAVAQLRLVYRDAEELRQSRRGFERELDRACAHYAAAGVRELAKAAQAFTAQPPFLLPFQGQDDRALMRKYGELLHTLMSAALPQRSVPRAMPPRATGGRIRVGFASAHFKQHSVWKVPLSGWVRELDRSKFQVFGYSLGSSRDAVTEEADRLCDRMIAGPMSLPAWAACIASDQLHVLVYPEIGMDRTTIQLAALRLAPVQCDGLAHPSTTGLPTIDFAFSGERLDSTDGQEQYTEKLVRLPNFGAYYEPPSDSATLDRDRASFGLPEGGVLYWVGHQLSTFLPEHDHLYARIAEQVEGSRMVFIAARSEDATAIFRERMARAFSARGLSFATRAVILPMMQPREFAAVTRLMDVGLDTPGWSGCNTTLETLMFDVPVVTLPGQVTRSRHAFAFLSMMGITETVAKSTDAFVDLAVRLGQDGAWRRSLSERIATTKALCYRDRTCVTALEEFLESCVGS